MTDDDLLAAAVGEMEANLAIWRFMLERLSDEHPLCVFLEARVASTEALLARIRDHDAG